MTADVKLITSPSKIAANAAIQVCIEAVVLVLIDTFGLALVSYRAIIIKGPHRFNRDFYDWFWFGIVRKVGFVG